MKNQVHRVFIAVGISLGLHTLIMVWVSWVSLSEKIIPQAVFVELPLDPFTQESSPPTFNNLHSKNSALSNQASNRDRVPSSQVEERIRKLSPQLSFEEKKQLFEKNAQETLFEQRKYQFKAEKIENQEVLDQILEQFKKNKSFTGQSRVSYFLKNRQGLHLPPPIYRCQKEAVVMVDIVVNSQGKVIKAVVNQTKSNHLDECSRQAALEYAYKSFFTETLEKEPQSGKIIYIFVPQ